MIICLVTDRRRLAHSGTDLLDLVGRAADAGIDLIQVRERDLEAAALVELVRQIVDRTRGSGTRVVVNDRADVAIAARADGVHLRHDSVPVARVRELASRPWLIGRSVHHVDDLSVVADADYLVAGTVFSTASKPGAAALLGLDGLRALASATPLPVLAIGGVTLDRVCDVAVSGAAGIAAITLFVTGELKGLVADVRRRFDSVNPAS